MYLSIPIPCHENWAAMTPSEKGRFCAACQKEVVDFTQFTETEISLFLSQNLFACGRFYKSQLNKEYPIFATPRKTCPILTWTKKWLVAAMLFATSTPVFTQNPPSNIKVVGVIRDKKNKQPVPFATALLFEVREDGSLVEMDKMSTDPKAKYDFFLEEGKKYKVVGNAEGYFANETKFSTEREDSSDSLLIEKNIDIETEVIQKLVGLVMINGYFESQKYFLTKETKDVLDRHIELLQKNPNITIQLGAHADENEVGENTYLLSELRAKAAIKYMVEQGIEPERLTFAAFGDSSPIFQAPKNADERQVNRRIEFRITSIDYHKK